MPGPLSMPKYTAQKGDRYLAPFCFAEVRQNTKMCPRGFSGKTAHDHACGKWKPRKRRDFAHTKGNE